MLLVCALTTRDRDFLNHDCSQPLLLSAVTALSVSEARGDEFCKLIKNSCRPLHDVLTIRQHHGVSDVLYDNAL